MSVNVTEPSKSDQVFDLVKQQESLVNESLRVINTVPSHTYPGVRKLNNAAANAKRSILQFKVEAKMFVDYMYKDPVLRVDVSGAPNEEISRAMGSLISLAFSQPRHVSEMDDMERLDEVDKLQARIQELVFAPSKSVK